MSAIPSVCRATAAVIECDFVPEKLNMRKSRNIEVRVPMAIMMTKGGFILRKGRPGRLGRME
jgi:hypothetical protein